MATQIKVVAHGLAHGISLLLFLLNFGMLVIDTCLLVVNLALQTFHLQLLVGYGDLVAVHVLLSFLYGLLHDGNLLLCFRLQASLFPGLFLG